MALVVINQSWTGAGPRATLNAGDTLFVGANISLISTGSLAVTTLAANTTVHVSSGAMVYGPNVSVTMGDPLTANKSLIVEDSAVLAAGNYAVFITGDNFRVANHGQISGVIYGIITQISASDHEGSIVNTGQIVGGFSGIAYNGTDSGTINLTNSGLIWGGSYSVQATTNLAYNIINTGELRGWVYLGDVSDILDNIGGLVVGDIFMNGGKDILRPGLGVEIASGGADIDLLDFTASGRVRVSLTDSAANTGAAAGDSYISFEDITGSLRGADRLEGDGFSNTLKGLGGNDGLYGMGGADSLEGGAGNDRLDGGTGADTMLGGAGNDTYIVDASGDRAYETTTAVSSIDAGGTDRVISSVNFTLGTFVENLTLSGSADLNGTGNTLGNKLVGNAGKNSLNGLLGNDTLTGGAGADRFVFNTALSATNIDRITDFAAGTDQIRLENAVFSGLAAGSLAANRFVSNATGDATSTGQRVIYDNVTGKLYFDVDGSGAGAAVQFATLSAGLALTNSDFFVI